MKLTALPLAPFLLTSAVAPMGAATSTALNLSTPTLCAEEDNVNIPLFGGVGSFLVEARHPTYEIGQDSCQADFSNCGDPGFAFRFGDVHRVWSIWDDGFTAVEAVQEPLWWRPRGMTVHVEGQEPRQDIHFVRVRRQVAGTSEFPEVFVLNMDGNVRLKPHPPLGRTDTCFGSSILIGPASIAHRPIAEIESVQFLPESSAFEVRYITGGSATIQLAMVTRDLTRIHVAVRYPVAAIPFATFRSMFVADGNADVDHVGFLDEQGNPQNQGILEFPGGGSSPQWHFFRATRSRHNTSAPDIFVIELTPSSPGGEKCEDLYAALMEELERCLAGDLSFGERRPCLITSKDRVFTAAWYARQVRSLLEESGCSQR